MAGATEALSTRFVYIDTDEKNNQLVFGVLPGVPLGPIRREIQQLSIPAKAVKLFNTPLPATEKTVRSRFRPLIGGIQIKFKTFAQAWPC